MQVIWYLIIIEHWDPDQVCSFSFFPTYFALGSTLLPDSTPHHLQLVDQGEQEYRTAMDKGIVEIIGRGAEKFISASPTINLHHMTPLPTTCNW